MFVIEYGTKKSLKKQCILIFNYPILRDNYWHFIWHYFEVVWPIWQISMKNLAFKCARGLATLVLGQYRRQQAQLRQLPLLNLVSGTQGCQPSSAFKCQNFLRNMPNRPNYFKMMPNKMPIIISQY